MWRTSTNWEHQKNICSNQIAFIGLVSSKICYTRSRLITKIAYNRWEATFVERVRFRGYRGLGKKGTSGKRDCHCASVKSSVCSTYTLQQCLDPQNQKGILTTVGKMYWEVSTLHSRDARLCVSAWDRLGVTNAQAHLIGRWVWQCDWPRRVWVCRYHARWVSGWRACGGGW